MNPLKSTAIHLLEIALIVAVVLLIGVAGQKFFGIDLSSKVEAVLALAILGAAKYLRASPDLPIKDYVNVK